MGNVTLFIPDEEENKFIQVHILLVGYLMAFARIDAEKNYWLYVESPTAK